jgi:hypothetical protein
MFLSGIIGAIWARIMAEGPKKRNTQLVSFCLCGSAFLIFGLYDLICIRVSNHSSATGVLTHLVRYNHGKSHGAFFHVHSADGGSLYVSSNYMGDHLIEGESVYVEMLDSNMQLLHLTVLDGPYAGWTLDERDGSIGAYVILALGLVFVLAAIFDRRRNPNGIANSVTLPTD